MIMKRYLAWALSLIMFLQLSACGTILYPERRGQPPGGNIDVQVAILDGIGLIFFLVPGIVAFATDFATGAIYLPAGGSNITGNSTSHQQSKNMSDFQTVRLDPDQLTQEKIEQIVYEKTGKSINLNDDNLQTIEVDNYDQLHQLLESADTSYNLT